MKLIEVNRLSKKIRGKEILKNMNISLLTAQVSSPVKFRRSIWIMMMCCGWEPITDWNVSI